MLFQEIPDDPPMHNIKHPRTSGLAMKQVLSVSSSNSTLINIFFNFSNIQRVLIYVVHSFLSQISNKITEIVKSGKSCLSIGGDHGIAIGE